MTTQKNKVTISAFLDWYFSIVTDASDFGFTAIQSLKDDGSFSTSVYKLFFDCGYIPQYICEDKSGDAEYDPFEVMLINNLPNESEIGMIGGEPTSYKFARKCNATGYGMNSGWVFDDDMNYFKYECDATQHAKDKGYSSLEEAYDNDICYYTEWDEVDSDEWYVSEHSDGREADKVIN